MKTLDFLTQYCALNNLSLDEFLVSLNKTHQEILKIDHNAEMQKVIDSGISFDELYPNDLYFEPEEYEDLEQVAQDTQRYLTYGDSAI